MRRGTLILLLFIILLAAGASYVVFWPNPDANGKPWHRIPNPFTFSYGIDIQGGLQVLLVPKAGQNATTDTIQTTANVLGSRINGLGLKEPTIRVLTTDNKESIEVDLPHFNGNEEETVNNLLKSGVLEFWVTPTILSEHTKFDPTIDPATDPTVDQTQYKQYQQDNPVNLPGCKKAPCPAFTGTDLNPDSLGVSQEQTGGYQIDFAMKSEKAASFATFTSNHINQVMTITLDKEVVTSATIRSTITGPGQITGKFTQAQAQGTVNTLKYGALPVALQKDSENTLQATLGSDTIKKSILAGIIGISIVALFMLLYYRLPGFLADLALALYTILTLAIFKLLGATLTLAGIAGLVLSIGMAVDANVLIFERVKEELRSGRVLASAIDMGWKRAWPSIRDSNISTLITCAVLYYFGSNFGATMITGFATTLALGVLVSMFTAIVVTRTLLNLLVPTGVINHPALFGLPAGSIAKDKASLTSRNATA
jgi:preprotein translocase subunit SecD